MRRYVFPLCAVILLILSAGAAFASVAIPGNNFIPGWTTSGDIQKFEKGHIFEYIDGGAEVYEEFGALQLQVQTYKNGNEELELLVYQMESPESALGIYLMTAGNEKPLADIKTRNSANSSQIFAVKSDCFIQITSLTPSTTSQQPMIQLANSAISGIADSKPVTLLTLLPHENIVSGSERLFRGPLTLNQIARLGKDDIFNLNGKLFGVSAIYKLRDKALVTRLIVPYPDETTAGTVFENTGKNIDPSFHRIRKTTVAVSYKNKEGIIINITLKGKTLEADYRTPANQTKR